MKQLEHHRCHNGFLSVYEHESAALKCPMRFSLYLPEQASATPVPLVTFLSGLTCTHENFTTKGCAYETASALGIALLAPDTSPRGQDIPDSPDHDLGQGAGFYLNATQEPWQTHYRMEDYIASELYTLIPTMFPVLSNAQGIMGHSMGGHGALTLFLKYPHHYKSVSAFAPIVAPSQVPWGQKAFTHYLGEEASVWKAHDACALVHTSQQKETSILIHQGLGDSFLETQLKPTLFEEACARANQSLILHQVAGYDHGYYFIQSFINAHLHHHARFLKAT